MQREVPDAMHSVDLRGVRITWLGHATFRVDTPAGKTVVIDPWVMNNPKCPENQKRFDENMKDATFKRDVEKFRSAIQSTEEIRGRRKSRD